MAIDIYWQKGKDKRKVGDFPAQEGLLSFFSLKTGIRIDEYGTTRLSINQLEVLIKRADELGISLDLTSSDNVNVVYVLESD
ncbi:hypothetical protein BH09BAC4_BH09BAC4_50200 [soil metagenome]